MQSLSQVVQDEFDKHNINSPFFLHNSNQTGPIRLHSRNTKNTHVDRLPQLLYVDDGALVFTCRDDICNGCQLVIDAMAKFGLTVHVGQNQMKPKLEAVFFPSRSTIQKWKEGSNNTLSLTMQNQPMLMDVAILEKESFDLHNAYEKAAETKTILLDNECKVEFQIFRLMDKFYTHRFNGY